MFHGFYELRIYVRFKIFSILLQFFLYNYPFFGQIIGSEKEGNCFIKSSFVVLCDNFLVKDSLNFLNSFYFASCASAVSIPIGRLNFLIIMYPLKLKIFLVTGACSTNWNTLHIAWQFPDNNLKICLDQYLVQKTVYIVNVLAKLYQFHLSVLL